jgi:hypothetical protein
MRPSALLFAILVLLCAIPVAAATAVPPASTLCPSTSSHLALPGDKTAQPDLRNPIFSPMGNIQYKDDVCTVTLDCPSGQQIQCSGATSSCTTTTVTCSSQGSTCPGQGGTVGAVACDGAVRASCPCPEVCFGCGASCTTNANCNAACTCGSGFCNHGTCTCPF